MSVSIPRLSSLALASLLAGWLLDSRTLVAQPPTFVAGSQPASAVMPPLPVWPSEGETITQREPVFRLNGRWNAAAYRVELARTPDFQDALTLSDFRVSENSGIAPVVLVSFQGKPLEDGRYFWRAFGRGPDEGWSPPANYRMFHVSSADRDAIEARPDLSRPRLVISADELPAFRARLQRSEHLQRGWQYLLNAAMSLLEAEPPDEAWARSGPGQHGYYNSAAQWYHRHLDNLAFVARVSNNKRLARKGVELLMAACRYERWLGPLFDNPKFFDPPWNAALETAMMTDAVAVAYDLLYDELTDPQRQIVRQALMEKGIRPLVSEWADPVGGSRIPRHQLATGNWVMVCSAGAGTGALALLGEHPDAPQAVRLVRNRIRAWLTDRGGDWCVDGLGPAPGPRPVLGPSEPNFGPQGGYKESITYMNYAMQYVCAFACPLRRITGENLFELFPKNLLEPVSWNMLAWPAPGGPRSRLIDFGDCGADAGFQDLYAALLKEAHDARAAWLYHRTVSVPRSIRALAWYDDTVAESAPAAIVPQAVFADVGQAVLRPGWSPDAPVAAIKLHQNRGHLDLGTFYLFGPGGPAIIDSGTTGYGSPVYRDYSSQTVAHNVVLVDGRPQDRTDGRLLAAVASSSLAAVGADLAPAYGDALESWRRDLVMLPGGDVIVLDELAAQSPRQFDYLLHPGPEFMVTGDDSLLLDTRAQITVHSSVPLRPVLQDGYERSFPRKYVRFQSSARTDRQSFAMLCRWPAGRAADGTPSRPATTRPAANEPGGLREIPGSPGRWAMDRIQDGAELLVRLGGAADRVDTDARVAVIYRPSVRQNDWYILVMDGRRLRLDGRDLLRADHPVWAAAESGSGLRASVHAAQPTRLELPAGESLTHAFLDGKPVEARRSGDAADLPVPPGLHDLELTDLSRPLARIAPLVASDLLAVEAPPRAPAFATGVRAMASTSGAEALAALDGDPNTAWTSLAGAAMPQWLLVSLPRPVRLNQIRLDPGQACEGRIDLFDTAARTWVRPRRFAVLSDRSEAVISLPTINTHQIRVVIEQVPGGGPASLKTLEWAEVEGLDIPEPPATQPAPRVSTVLPLATRDADVLRRALASRPASATRPSGPDPTADRRH